MIYLLNVYHNISVLMPLICMWVFACCMFFFSYGVKSFEPPKALNIKSLFLLLILFSKQTFLFHFFNFLSELHIFNCRLIIRLIILSRGGAGGGGGGCISRNKQHQQQTCLINKPQADWVSLEISTSTVSGERITL